MCNFAARCSSLSQAPRRRSFLVAVKGTPYIFSFGNGAHTRGIRYVYYKIPFVAMALVFFPESSRCFQSARRGAPRRRETSGKCARQRHSTTTTPPRPSGYQCQTLVVMYIRGSKTDANLFRNSAKASCWPPPVPRRALLRLSLSHSSLVSFLS